jgi:hypothetical protein
MNPALIAAVLSLVEEAISQEPAIAAALQNIFSKPNPTPEDWAAVRAAVLAATPPTVETGSVSQ